MLRSREKDEGSDRPLLLDTGNSGVKGPSQRKKLGWIVVVGAVALVVIMAVLLSVSLKKRKHHGHDHRVDGTVDIHVKLEPIFQSAAVSMNNYTRAFDENVQVDLTDTALPHITLYLTQFKSHRLQEVRQRLDELVRTKFSTGQPCGVLMSPTVYNSSAYAMWNVTLTECLQYYSDAVVNATMEFIVPNQPVPDWIKTLPPDLAKIKEEYVKRYGSPNVFSQFEPHVTISADSKTPLALGSLLADEDFTKLIVTGSFNVANIGMGHVGPFGTVLRGKDYADFSVDPASTSAHRHDSVVLVDHVN